MSQRVWALVVGSPRLDGCVFEVTFKRPAQRQPPLRPSPSERVPMRARDRSAGGMNSEKVLATPLLNISQVVAFLSVSAASLPDAALFTLPAELLPFRPHRRHRPQSSGRDG